MKYGEKQNEIFELINNHIGLNISYLEKTQILPYLVNLNNEYAIKKAVMTVCSKKEKKEDRKTYFLNYIKLLIRNK